MHIVRFRGGFANQLFQYAFMCLLREKNLEVRADLSHYKSCNDHGGFILGRFIKIDTIKKIPSNFVTVDENNYDEVDFATTDQNYYYNGYWQDSKYFPNDLSFLDNIFNTDNLRGRNRSYYEKINSAPYSVSVHVRRGDYVNNSFHGNIANLAYFTNSIRYICDVVPNPHFFVFSDDINWCKNNIDFNGQVVTYIEGNKSKAYLDMFLMSLCNANIISNSSFSWWAQFINKHEDRLVVTPEYWFNDDSMHELYVRDAIKIPNYLFREKGNDNPFFSICIPMFNVGIRARRCLASVLGQTFCNIEVIIVDDGSTDCTSELVQEYAKNDARIILIKNEKNLSMLTSRMIAMQHGKGKYFLFVDPNDYIEETMCESLYQKITDVGEVDIIEYGYIQEPSKAVFKADECELDFTNPITPIRKILNGEYNHTIWNKCYSKNIVNKLVSSISPFYCNMGEDVFFSVVFCYFCRNIEHINIEPYHYVECNGVMYNVEPDQNNLIQLIESIKNAHVMISLFLDYDNIGDDLTISRNNTLSTLAHICWRSNLSIREKMELANFIDNACNTEFEKRYEAEIYAGIELKQKLSRGGKLNKVKYFLKQVLNL